MNVPNGLNRCGFTLVEVLVAIVVLGVVSVGIVGFFSTIVTTSRATSAEQSQTIEVKSFLESVALAWEDEDAFDLGSLPNVPGVPVDCAVTSSVMVQNVRTLVVECVDVDGPFVLALGRP